ncbi:hypothetical protein EV200_1085 [Pedobacter psychrotolerans]|uniref:Uncharacterized protein n=1 Tax=Pedobacter psychrotolerans TaxID=1843235 RepID=A0A4R2H840_9SPHI|nr:hypothetical protein [Pedobacter psychrotolerans]TCO20565.1 hypothetical protein EV200_1085 [Pedobacter psychrotolerans]GGE66459.1 hypothetical protein GCM10011413_36240 [Pedobacter psychrotolerans]
MNIQIMNQYGISFNKKVNGVIETGSNSIELTNYLYLYSRYKPSLEEFISAIDLALNGQFDSIDEDDKVWSQELGYDMYIGTILDESTFELYLADHYEETVKIYPLIDVREIFNSLLEFIQ